MSRQQLQEVLARLDPAKLHCEVLEGCGVEVGNVGRHRIRHERGLEVVVEGLAGRLLDADLRHRSRDQRSEEHTSELQSRSDLVCRLLLEKKKKKQKDMLRILNMQQSIAE